MSLWVAAERGGERRSGHAAAAGEGERAGCAPSRTKSKRALDASGPDLSSASRRTRTHARAKTITHAQTHTTPHRTAPRTHSTAQHHTTHIRHNAAHDTTRTHAQMTSSAPYRSAWAAPRLSPRLTCSCRALISTARVRAASERRCAHRRGRPMQRRLVRRERRRKDRANRLQLRLRPRLDLHGHAVVSQPRV